ncbi:MAG: ATP-binding protein [Proteobacteria bacterium]|nr:ATP-binding protein [Pseudomonadota bacterium]MDA1023354.1 ATP-binding protein [Pseudomonadota bacterium]
MFRLLRYYSIASGIALLAVAMVLVFVYRSISIDQVLENVETENVAMSRAFANAIWPRFAGYVTTSAPTDAEKLQARPETAEIHEVAKSLVVGLNVVKIKIYRLDGLVVYSSDFSQIGKKDHNPSLRVAARKGHPTSKLEFRPEFNGINGVILERQIVSSYVPILGPDGNIEGIFELYSDVTTKIMSVTGDVAWLSIGLIWTFGILYGVLFFFVRRADTIIKQQYADLHHEVIERLETEQKLNDALAQAESANQSKSHFLAHMSHELRTPLNSIIGFSETISSQVFGKLENEKYLEYTRDIHGSGMHLLSLINEVLDISKVEAGAMVMHEEKVDLTSMMKNCAAMMQNDAKKVGIELKVSLARDLPQFHGDELRLKQIFLNLLSNAIKFTPTGGTITMQAGLDAGGRLMVSVADTGIGIDIKDQSRILKPFEQVEDTFRRSAKGTGLGLALSKSLTELHGGELSLESEPGIGTTVTLSFPPERAMVREPQLPLGPH